jgi:uncharacterized protein YndB with AHSA1/START domain
MVEDPAVVVERVLAATPEEVFHEWVDPHALADWMCPHPAHPVKVEVDARVGGGLLLDIEDGDDRFTVTGTYLQVAPPRLLQFTWSCTTWEDPTVESVVTVTLEPHGTDETRMTIHHALLPPPQVANHAHGWTLIAQQLGEALDRRR